MLSLFKKSSTSCKICNNAINGKELSIPSCSCLFHKKCFTSWFQNLKGKNEYKCPLCNHNFDKIVIKNGQNGMHLKTISLSEGQISCPICLETLQSPIAQPESCDHYFCLTCLDSWTQFNHGCPLDRTEFKLILISDFPGGKVKSTKPVRELVRIPSDNEEDSLENIACEVCRSAENEDSLLLCDDCNKGYHMYCLDNPLTSVPSGEWFCPQCQNQNESDVDVWPVRSGRSSIIFDEAYEMNSSHVDSDVSGSSQEVNGLRRIHTELDDDAQHKLHTEALRLHQGRSRLTRLIEQMQNRVVVQRARRRNRRNLRSQSESLRWLDLNTSNQGQNNSDDDSPINFRPKNRRRRVFDDDNSSDEQNSPQPKRVKNKIFLESEDESAVQLPCSSKSKTRLNESFSSCKPKNSIEDSDNDLNRKTEFRPTVDYTSTSDNEKFPQSSKIKKITLESEAESNLDQSNETATGSSIYQSEYSSKGTSKFSKIKLNCLNVSSSNEIAKSVVPNFQSKRKKKRRKIKKTKKTKKGKRKTALAKTLSSSIKSILQSTCPNATQTGQTVHTQFSLKIPNRMHIVKSPKSPSDGKLLEKLLSKQEEFLALPRFNVSPSSQSTRSSIELPKADIPTSSTSSRLTQNDAWSEVEIGRAKKLIKGALKSSFCSGQISKEECRSLYNRCLNKVLCKDPNKVIDSKITQLAHDYVRYIRENKS